MRAKPPRSEVSNQRRQLKSDVSRGWRLFGGLGGQLTYPDAGKRIHCSKSEELGSAARTAKFSCERWLVRQNTFYLARNESNGSADSILPALVDRFRALIWAYFAGRMQSYVQDIRQNAVGQGIVCEFPAGGPYQRGYVPTNAVSSTWLWCWHLFGSHGDRR